MTNQQILLQQILREIVENHILRPQPIRRRDPTDTRHLMHIDQRPAARERGMRIPPGPIDEHHVGHHAHVMLPPMPELMPPFLLYDLGFVDLVDGPEVGVCLVEEDGLEDVVFVGDGGFTGSGGAAVCGILAELVLVVCAVEGHFDLVHVFRVGMGVVHGAEACGFVVRTRLFVLGEGDCVFLLL